MSRYKRRWQSARPEIPASVDLSDLIDSLWEMYDEHIDLHRRYARDAGSLVGYPDLEGAILYLERQGMTPDLSPLLTALADVGRHAPEGAAPEQVIEAARRALLEQAKAPARDTLTFALHELGNVLVPLQTAHPEEREAFDRLWAVRDRLKQSLEGAAVAGQSASPDVVLAMTEGGYAGGDIAAWLRGRWLEYERSRHTAPDLPPPSVIRAGDPAPPLYRTIEPAGDAPAVIGPDPDAYFLPRMPTPAEAEEWQGTDPETGAERWWGIRDDGRYSRFRLRMVGGVMQACYSLTADLWHAITPDDRREGAVIRRLLIHPNGTIEPRPWPVVADLAGQEGGDPCDSQ